ncbi:MAG: glucosylceramidase [Bacteroidales bacterium]|nr:glucosylceramidase [Bacteroidales bacterium]
MTILSLTAALLLSAASCNDEPFIDDTPKPQTEPAATPSGNTATIYTTTADGIHRLNKSEVEIASGNNMAPTTIVVDPTQTFQSMDGFGFAITYSTCYNLMKMSDEARHQFLNETYSVSEGYGVSYARISIGCNDFSSTEYSLCDDPGLENFALYSDEKDYVIPVLKEILAINPAVKIIAAPWTCPKWMKVSDLSSLNSYDRWIGGRLNPEYRETYAQYFVKFINAMQAEGIDIYAVSPQNEPLNQGNCASLFMPWEEEAAFVTELAKAFKQNSLKTKIYLFDHNYNYDNLAEEEDYPVKIYNALGNEFEGSEYIAGAAYHDYGGNNSELSDIHAKADDKELIFSESSIGTWNDGRNLSKRLMEDMNNITLGTVNQWCKAVLVWNLMLDVNMGPNLDGGCQTCYGAVDISADYQTITRNSHYYVISHMSSVVRPGAVRIGTTKRSVEKNGLVYTAFQNSDGSYAVVILNNSDNNIPATISDGNSFFQASVPARSVVSCNWK